MYDVMHSGAWLPRSAWADEVAWDRLINWISEHSRGEDIPLIVTPHLDNSMAPPDGLSRIADNAQRQDEHGQGPGRNWRAGDGPIIIVWPKPQTVKKWVQAVAGLSAQSIILVEQEKSDQRFPSFRGWAMAVAAFNAATDSYERPNQMLTDLLDDVFTSYENELALSPTSALAAYPTSTHLLRQKLQAVHADGCDEDFIMSYAIALGYTGDLRKLLDHYRAAGPA